ncbi:hypothetical protein CONPUDRAFT_140837 [Coniophora puteana RWD-64-598 SS2]|uniref:F-box domain-containing protein n=1 Tax=Coniophora puteana (strain RWD-64-598) TaxID=741705 RepID=A0A5M3N4C1_CONPW|nr:uncharacterized protein CONPUDRAFT_140837 [Coniophora puteana RWD-64-598 SS2]EIW86146.1 hypothetical protein CONPUDRAFT_140837 [Coniophora puteana RWD-64-598 SS2]
MHQALALHEILQDIFGHLGDWTEFVTYPSERKRTLASLARTCKAFTKPAIEELWHMMDAVGIFQNLIPHRRIMRWPGGPDPLGWSVPSQMQVWIHDIKPLSIAEQARLMSYTSCIKRLFLPSIRSGLPVAAPALQVLLSLPGGVEQAFPRLKEISVLDIFPGALTSYEPFMQHATSLNFQPSNIDKGASLLPPSISQVLRPLHHLRSFSCEYVDPPTLLHLSQLPFLTNLCNQNVLDIASTPVLVFPALQSLELDLRDFAQSLFLVKRLAWCPSSLHIFTLNCVPSLFDSEEMFSIISKHPAADLRSLSAMSFDDSSVDLNTSMTLDTIKPLLRFSNMRVFNWCFPCLVDLGDSDILAIAHAWPNLRRLCISSNARADTHKPRIESLFAMAQQCPYLEHLMLSFAISELNDIPPDHLADGFTHSQLRSLHSTCATSCADEDELVTLTIILGQVFPGLGYVGGINIEEPLRQVAADVVSDSSTGVYINAALGTLRQARVDGKIRSCAGEGVRRMVRGAFERMRGGCQTAENVV